MTEMKDTIEDFNSIVDQAEEKNMKTWREITLNYKAKDKKTEKSKESSYHLWNTIKKYMNYGSPRKRERKEQKAYLKK